ncbi:MAG: tRNA pseudouridine(55) synthase TruB [Enterobacterales bacterium]
MNVFNKINGILLLDKPYGISSNLFLQKIKKLLYIKKIGHTGTLDVLSTGMLPMCLGQATKCAKYFLNFNKKYKVIAKLGERTITGDAEGDIISIRPVLIMKSNIKNALNIFKGEIYQIPPMFSSIKYKGKHLYEYARKNIILKRKPRKIHVYSIKLLFYSKKIIELEIYCSKGTYIRSIIDDLGEKLNCGAHIMTLRRIKIDNFNEKNMITLRFLDKISNNVNLFTKEINKVLLPIDKSMNFMPQINLNYEISKKIKFGQIININKYKKQSGLFRLTEGKEKKFFGIGELLLCGKLIPKNIFFYTHF